VTDLAVRTAEDAPPPPRVNPVLAGWRSLTSMRTALLLLFLLALGAVPGSILPQRGLNADKVREFFTEHPTLAPLLDRLSLFDVFAAPWFAAIYLLLFLSLAGCVVPRLWRHAGALGARPPAAPRHLARLPVATSYDVDGAPADVLAAARARLRGWRCDVRTEPDGAVVLAAERGHVKELGNLAFHLALLLLLAGVALGGLFGYKGNVLVREHDGFSNTVGAYDEFKPGRLVSPDRLAPYTLVLDDFRATYQRDGQPATFTAHVRYSVGTDARLRPATLRVNSPLRAGGANVYLIGHGYAPHFVVHGPDGRVVFDASVPFLPRDANFNSDGVVKVPDIAPAPDGSARQLGFVGFFAPTTVRTPRGLESAFPDARDPSVTLLAYQGDLGLDSGRPQSVYALDTARMTALTDAAGRPFAKTLSPGQTMVLPQGAGTLTFAGFDEFVTLSVTSDPGRQLALVAAVLAVAGLVVSLRVRRRRFWLRARADGSRSVVAAGGLARDDADDFTADFARLVARLRGD
jgi:cytochrome c biogenesis protein